jgi:hypothetical protein
MAMQPNPSRTKVKVRRKEDSDVGKVNDGQWWKLEREKDRGQSAWDTLLMLNSSHAGRHMRDALNVGLYENKPPYWAPTRSDPLLAMAVSHGGRRVPLNLVKSVIDTAAAQIAKNDAELKAHTDGGSWHAQRKGRLITKYNSGAFYLNKFRRHQKRAFIDGCLTEGRGAVKFWADYGAGQVKCARAHPRTILWNGMEGDDPRNLYQWAPVARDVLLNRFGDDPKKRAIIAKSKNSVNPVNPAYKRVSELAAYADMIDVGEAWHLGQRNDPESGKHILRVEGGTVVDEPWPFEFFPFATFNWDDCDEGWGGKPLADILSTYQAEINRYIRIYRKGLERAAAMAGPWVERTVGDMGEMQGANNDGEVWKPRTYTGKEPVFAAPVAFGADFFNFIVWQYDKAFAEAGFSMMQAQGEKPEGVDAAVAMRELADITSTRQVPKGQRYEWMTEDAGNIQMALSKQMFTKGDVKAIKVRAPGTKFLTQVDFADIADVEEDAYILKQSVTSALPTHFVGRLQSVVDMVRGGVLPKKKVEEGMGLRLLQMPDLEKEIDIETAARELTSMQVDEALYEGKYIPPQPYQSPDLLIETAQNTVLFAQTLKEVPRRNMQLLERLISEAAGMKKRSQALLGPMPQPTAGPAAAALAPAQVPGLLPPTPGPAQQIVQESPAVPLPNPAGPAVPAVPSAMTPS